MAASSPPLQLCALLRRYALRVLQDPFDDCPDVLLLDTVRLVRHLVEAALYAMNVS